MSEEVLNALQLLLKTYNYEIPVTELTQSAPVATVQSKKTSDSAIEFVILESELKTQELQTLINAIIEKALNLKANQVKIHQITTVDSLQNLTETEIDFSNLKTKIFFGAEFLQALQQKIIKEFVETSVKQKADLISLNVWQDFKGAKILFTDNLSTLLKNNLAKRKFWESLKQFIK